jgi:hypothetical protein
MYDTGIDRQGFIFRETVYITEMLCRAFMAVFSPLPVQPEGTIDFIPVCLSLRLSVCQSVHNVFRIDFLLQCMHWNSVHGFILMTYRSGSKMVAIDQFLARLHKVHPAYRMVNARQVGWRAGVSSHTFRLTFFKPFTAVMDTLKMCMWLFGSVQAFFEKLACRWTSSFFRHVLNRRHLHLCNQLLSHL